MLILSFVFLVNPDFSLLLVAAYVHEEIFPIKVITLKVLYRFYSYLKFSYPCRIFIGNKKM